MKLITITIVVTDEQANELQDRADNRDESTEGMIDDVISEFVYDHVTDFDSANVRVTIK